MYVGVDAELCSSTKFSRRAQDGKRLFYINEYQYNSNYIDTRNAYSLKRDMRTYLILKYRKDNNLSVLINIYDYYTFMGMIDTYMKVISSDKLTRFVSEGPDGKNRIFTQLENTIYINNKPLVFSLFIDSNTNMCGIELKLSSIDSIYIDTNTLYSMHYILYRFDFYQTFMMHSNFIASWKQENYGKNLTVLPSNSGEYQNNAALKRDDTEMNTGVSSKLKKSSKSIFDL